MNLIEPLAILKNTVSKDDLESFKAIYRGRYKGEIYEGNYVVVREYNQPKRNIMAEELMDIKKIVALFCFREEK